MTYLFLLNRFRIVQGDENGIVRRSSDRGTGNFSRDTGIPPVHGGIEFSTHGVSGFSKPSARAGRPCHKRTSARVKHSTLCGDSPIWACRRLLAAHEAAGFVPRLGRADLVKAIV